MTDLRERAPASAAMEKLVSFRGTDELSEWPFGLVHVKPEALNWLRGVRGELFMARSLAKLGREWTVLHSVPVGTRGLDIDHLVIGPAGVFPINTKRLIDREVRVDGAMFRSDGWKEPYLRKSALEARRVIGVMNRLGLAAPVLPIIAISGARSVKVKSAPRWEDVTIGVAAIEKVVKRLKQRKAVLSSVQVELIVEALSDSAVWTTSEPAVGRNPDLISAVRRIDRGVGRLRTLILVVGGSLMLVGAWFVGTQLANLLDLVR